MTVLRSLSMTLIIEEELLCLNGNSHGIFPSSWIFGLLAICWELFPHLSFVTLLDVKVSLLVIHNQLSNKICEFRVITRCKYSQFSWIYILNSCYLRQSSRIIVCWSICLFHCKWNLVWWFDFVFTGKFLQLYLMIIWYTSGIISDTCKRLSL